MKKLSLVLPVVVFLAAPATAPGQSAEQADEYSVYAAALDEAVGGISYVVLSTTGIHGRPADLDRALNFPVEIQKLVTPDLVRDFKSKNQKPSTLVQRFPQGLRVTLLSEEERSAIFTGRLIEGWNDFNRKYSGGSGITTLSRVGFNKARDRAILYVGNVRHPDAGGGAYYMLAKKDGKWSALGHTRGWMM